MFISITFTETSIDETNKTQQKVRGSKFVFKMSTIHTNTCSPCCWQPHTQNCIKTRAVISLKILIITDFNYYLTD